MDLRNERADSRLCKIHFAISDKNGLPNDSVPSYVPYACLVCGEQFDWIADAKLHLMNNPGHRAPKKLINLNIPRHEVIPEQPKSQECDFCDEPELPYRLSPRDRTSAQRFFATLNARTGKDLLESFLFNACRGPSISDRDD
ncbi:hypothetical protein PMAYCL1PPCAC_19571 [Pristionchus mayeri]|uniref:C2H2-type domain-containing protein n=1 Tax=Pristionchus mayeri TaxID=1317129 RepID=A0AAN5CRM6_9BILA|nr:hypothetical protein PMAYCL1PPCAC_19571 [Pristionchus mayeri]